MSKPAIFANIAIELIRTNTDYFPKREREIIKWGGAVNVEDLWCPKIVHNKNK
jgi:hypothetical protein